MSAAAAQKESPDRTALKAVVVYSDFDFASHATALLERVAFQADAALQWEVKPWRLDILKHVSLAEIAGTESVDADMIVLALAETDFPSEELMAWLEHWAARRQIVDAAVVLLCPGQDAASTALGAQLQQLAALCGFTFLGEARSEESSAPTLSQPEFPLTPDFPRMPDHWGLND